MQHKMGKETQAKGNWRDYRDTRERFREREVKAVFSFAATLTLLVNYLKTSNEANVL